MKEEVVVECVDIWYFDFEQDCKLGGFGVNQCVCEDCVFLFFFFKKVDFKKLKNGEFYMDYVKCQKKFFVKYFFEL